MAEIMWVDLAILNPIYGREHTVFVVVIGTTELLALGLSIISSTQMSDLINHCGKMSPRRFHARRFVVSSQLSRAHESRGNRFTTRIQGF